MNQVIDRLLLESQRAKLAERRTEARHELVRPVNVLWGSNDSCSGFSKNLSKQGIGIIVDQELSVGTIACLSIHSLTSQPVNLKCELRWIDPYGKGWWILGWKFLSIAPPASVIRSR
ncbi:MAG: PilZ domain-containing protein [Fuerstiella sp.]